MIETVAALVEIVTKAPTGIDYFYMPPTSQWVPAAVLKKPHIGESFTLSVVGINNVSTRVLQSIRIKLPFAPTYDPTLEVHGIEESVCAQYSADMHEISVQQLDPGESIYVVIFLSNDEIDAFSEPVVIVRDRLLSRGMRAVGFIKRRPKDVLLMIAALCAPLVLAMVLGYFVLDNTSLNPRVRAVQHAMRGFVGCVPTAYRQSVVNDAILSKNMLGYTALLQMNHVSSLEQLRNKKYVVICIAR